MQTQTTPQETWIKVLSKGVITIPKEFREQLGLEEGDVAKAKVVGNALVIQSRKVSEYSDYRLFTKEQIDAWVKEDVLPEPLANQTEKYWSVKLK
ncbi:MAG: AbrB/MazE/SpoVT family DNA-binding domain-containing protein [Candidatus Levyibacteriota bacterium]